MIKEKEERTALVKTYCKRETKAYEKKGQTIRITKKNTWKKTVTINLKK